MTVAMLVVSRQWAAYAVLISGFVYPVRHFPYYYLCPCYTLPADNYSMIFDLPHPMKVGSADSSLYLRFQSCGNETTTINRRVFDVLDFTMHIQCNPQFSGNTKLPVSGFIDTVLF